MFATLIILILLAVLLARKRIIHRRQIQSVTDLSRGEWSERDLIPTLINECGIDPRAIYHDLYLRKSSGTYAQVDLVVALPQGLVVFEVKDYSGWIFGNERSKYWMQIMAYGQEKHQFYNPIWQNNSHITALRNAMPNNHGIEIFNVVVFHGDCEFKDVNYSQAGRTRVIYNTQVARVIKNIKTLPPTHYDYGNKREVAAVLSAAVRNGKDPEIRAAQMAYASRNSYNGNAHHEYSTRWFRMPSQRTLRKRMLRNIFKYCCPIKLNNGKN